MAKVSWSTVIPELFIVVVILLPPQVLTYRILIMPLPSKSHAFSLAVLADDLATHGHLVTIFMAQNFCHDTAELNNRTGIDVVRYRDVADGEKIDYKALTEDVAKTAMEAGGNGYQVALLVRKLYVCCCLS